MLLVEKDNLSMIPLHDRNFSLADLRVYTKQFILARNFSEISDFRGIPWSKAKGPESGRSSAESGRSLKTYHRR